MIPSLEEDVGVMLAPGKLKKHPGAGPLGHSDGLMIEFGFAYMLLLLNRLEAIMSIFVSLKIEWDAYALGFDWYSGIPLPTRSFTNSSSANHRG